MEDEIIRQMKEQGFEVAESDVEEDTNFMDNLTVDAIQAINLFKVLPDIFIGAGMGGLLWIGKNLSSLEYIMDLQEIINRKRVFELFQICNEEYSKFINKEITKK